MNKITSILTAVVAGLLLASPAQAQDLSVGQPPQFQITSVGDLIEAAIGMTLIIAGILVFAYLVWGGIQWITSGGDKGKTDEARGRITAALVGLAIVASAYAVMLLVEQFFGISLGTDSLPKAY